MCDSQEHIIVSYNIIIRLFNRNSTQHLIKNIFCLFQVFYFFLYRPRLQFAEWADITDFGNDILTHGDLMRFILLLRIYRHGLWYVYTIYIIQYYIATVCGFVLVVDSARAINHPYFYPSKLNSDLLAILPIVRFPIYRLSFSYDAFYQVLSLSLKSEYK